MAGQARQILAIDRNARVEREMAQEIAFDFRQLDGLAVGAQLAANRREAELAEL